MISLVLLGHCSARVNIRNTAQTMELQDSGMLSRDQLLYLFDRFDSLISQPEVKTRIADAVNDKQEPVAVTTTIQEEIFMEMGVDPQFGLSCLGKVSLAYEDDRDLIIQFYGFVAKEEIACEEAELGPERFAERTEMLRRLEAEQLEMLKNMRNFQLDDQSAILEKIHQQMENAGFEPDTSLLSVEQIQDIVGRRVTPVFQPI
ncbi:hypothetical protein SASPL_137494 [Salvia splendens]|uniref:Uncharacterized protein n=2 Tax=Salvia splendens TaxID=180675 RepID=A0A8X8WV23_SALSN|nr:hypothetical protein SASPL_137494 [Salvia splendens]